jgi:hypothetical protein
LKLDGYRIATGCSAPVARRPSQFFSDKSEP